MGLNCDYMTLFVMQHFLEDMGIESHICGRTLHLLNLPDHQVDEVIKKCEALGLCLCQKATPIYLPYDPNDPETKDGNLKIKSFIFSSWIEPEGSIKKWL